MKRIRIVCCLMVLAGICACGVDNTMYNARKYFNSAQAKPLNTNGRPSPQAVEEYTKTIQKCGIIISRGGKGKRMDDAVFLMAKALYHKGNSAFQAKDQFENLIFGFPDSKHVPEAHIYVARVLWEINQPKDAEKRLDEFIRNPEFHKDHAKALLLMADFAIKDKDYDRAQFWLDKLIREYPRTKQFKEAFFLFGKNYYEQKDYARSREAFVKMQHSRGIDKAMKLDAAYYVALNDLELRDYEPALKGIKRLLKTETRPEKASGVRVLYGRILLAKGDSDAALSELNYVIKTYPRTESAASAYYFLGEHYYFNASDIANAVTNYNRVRTEFSTSTYATLGQSKATALGNINPKAGLNAETGLSQFLDYYYMAAESFVNTLALPDSAIAYYYKVIAQRDSLSLIKQTLIASIDSTRISLDSLQTKQTSMPVDTLVTEADSIRIDDYAVVDSTVVVADSIKTEDYAVVDSTVVVADSAAVAQELPTETPDQEYQRKQNQLQSDMTVKENRLKGLNEVITRFDNEIVPFCLFAIGSIMYEVNPAGADNAAILARMQEHHASNKYTRALKALYDGQTVRLIDPFEEAQEALLDSLLGMIETEPDSALAGLIQLQDSPIPAIKLAAAYRLGWYYSFDAPDTAAAKPYLKAVLDNSLAGDYGTTVRRFYNGNQFLLRESSVKPDTIVAVQDSMLLSIPVSDSIFIGPSLPAGDSLRYSIPMLLSIPVSDSLFIGPSLPAADSLRYSIPMLDSLLWLENSTTSDSLRDSLNVEQSQKEEVPKPEVVDVQPPTPETPPSPDVIKDEEPKLE